MREIKSEKDFVLFCQYIRKNIKGRFIDRMISEKHGFNFSLSGDKISWGRKCGLPQSAFALRIMKIMNILDEEMSRHIFRSIANSKNRDGTYSDKCVRLHSIPRRLYYSVRNRDMSHFLNKYNQRAQTRQALAALINLGKKANDSFLPIEPTGKHASDFIGQLDWGRPWGAASHLNGLIFFIRNSDNLDDNLKELLYDSIEKKLESYQNSDGSFSLNGMQVSQEQKIGSFMKIIMGFSQINREERWISTKMVDEALEFHYRYTADDACTNFNTLYTLTKARSLNYRRDEIFEYTLNEVNSWLDYFYEEYSAFSFSKNKAQTYFHAATVSKGLNEPDMHGTAMYVWGLLIASNVLDVSGEAGLSDVVL